MSDGRVLYLVDGVLVGTFVPVNHDDDWMFRKAIRAEVKHDNEYCKSTGSPRRRSIVERIDSIEVIISG